MIGTVYSACWNMDQAVAPCSFGAVMTVDQAKIPGRDLGKKYRAMHIAAVHGDLIEAPPISVARYPGKLSSFDGKSFWSEVNKGEESRDVELEDTVGEDLVSGIHD